MRKLNIGRLKYLSDNLDKAEVECLSNNLEWYCEICHNHRCLSILKYSLGKYNFWICEKCRDRMYRLMAEKVKADFKKSIHNLKRLAKNHRSLK